MQTLVKEYTVITSHTGFTSQAIRWFPRLWHLNDAYDAIMKLFNLQLLK